MNLRSIEESLLLATLFRGGRNVKGHWNANSDQIVTLSLFFTGDISPEDCVSRFSRRGYVGGIYDAQGELREEVENRYRMLINLVREHPELIVGAGGISTAHPSYTACALTSAGESVATACGASFPRHPEFPDWPDRRAIQNAN